MTNFLRTQQINTELISANSGVTHIFTADKDDSANALNAFYKGTLRSLILEVFLPELPEIDIPISRLVNGNFTPETHPYRGNGRYLALCVRRKGETDWLVRREFLLLRRKGLERETIDILSPAFGATFFDLHHETELGLIVQGGKGAGSLGASEYIRVLGAVDELYSAATGETGGTGNMSLLEELNKSNIPDDKFLESQVALASEKLISKTDINTRMIGGKYVFWMTQKTGYSEIVIGDYEGTAKTAFFYSGVTYSTPENRQISFLDAADNSVLIGPTTLQDYGTSTGWGLTLAYVDTPQLAGKNFRIKLTSTAINAEVAISPMVISL